MFFLSLLLLILLAREIAPSTLTICCLLHQSCLMFSSFFLCWKLLSISFFFLGKKRRLLLLPLLRFARRCCCVFSFAQPRSARTSSARRLLANKKLHRARWRVAIPPSSSLPCTAAVCAPSVAHRTARTRRSCCRCPLKLTLEAVGSLYLDL